MAAKPMGGSRGTTTEGTDREWLLELIVTQPDLVLEVMRHADIKARQGCEATF